ncbi:hypothetical protein B2J88_30640 [Rhodococcus sp. SRB_17]|uniref:PH domain-containing protein n=1 Tax=Rhodococcus sp. OK302 TaxID=1882769 RepID=UPI000B93FD7D|nr:PH domain-containing protein [Rhodococcus sp. OK302]NMM88655.1 hypothetical protein [Rhodococcus sp. SRB_17]OYD67417.1 PH (Pleckstrin Homology) domain-containing protein [Rhodococcus sp. OK302]
MLEDEFHPQPPGNGSDVVSWATPMGAVYAMFGGGIALAIATIVVPTETAGRFLLALAVIGLFVMGGLALKQRPRLAVIDDNGSPAIAVQRLLARHVFTREQIDRARLVRYPRLGRRVPMLEIDIVDRPTDTEKLLIFGRWDLGTNPEDVLDVLTVHGLVPPEK